MESVRNGVPDGPGFIVAAVVLCNDDGEILCVRKKGTHRFMLPGGKIEPGEMPDQTAVREIKEELGIELQRDALHSLGQFLAVAANEAGHWVRSDVYTYPHAINTYRVAAEIAEARWVSADHPPEDFAPLFYQVLSVVRGDTF